MVLLLLCFYSITFVTHRELPVLLLRGRPWKESCDPSPTAWATWQPRPRLTYFLYSLSVLSAWLCPCNRRSVPNSRSDCDCSVRVSRRNLFFFMSFLRRFTVFNPQRFIVRLAILFIIGISPFSVPSQVSLRRE